MRLVSGKQMFPGLPCLPLPESWKGAAHGTSSSPAGCPARVPGGSLRGGGGRTQPLSGYPVPYK